MMMIKKKIKNNNRFCLINNSNNNKQLLQQLEFLKMQRDKLLQLLKKLKFILIMAIIQKDRKIKKKVVELK